MKVWHRHGPLACALLVAACCRATAQAPPPDPFQEWLTVREALLGARGLVAYYDFQEGDGATLTNRVSGGEALNGTLHEAKWAEGRWPGKHGLAFDGQGAYVEIPHHPGLYPFGADGTDELTLAVSMLADSTAEAGLVDKSSAGWGRDTPYALWITSGAIAAGVGDGTDCTLVRDPVEAPTGQWLTLVLVVEATRVRLYKNGLEAGLLPFPRTHGRTRHLQPGSERARDHPRRPDEDRADHRHSLTPPRPRPPRGAIEE